MPRLLTFLLAACVCVGILAFSLAPVTTYRFADESRIWVEGTSTVHDWDCQVTRFLGRVNADTEGARMTALASARVTIPVRSIDCDNGTMNGKLRDALGEEAVRYELTRAVPAAAGADGWFAVETTGTLTISGTSRPARLSMRAKANGDGSFRFTGTHSFRMTDFGIDPPTALLGTLKTGDDLTVRFDVVIASE